MRQEAKWRNQEKEKDEMSWMGVQWYFYFMSKYAEVGMN